MLSDYSLFSSDGDETSSYAETTDDEEAVFLQLSCTGQQESEGGGGKFVKINQYAQDVVDFSSQYGSDTSISYTAYNVTGKPSKYPDYGDFPETFAFRTYGTWWKKAPSACGEFGRNGRDSPEVDDYILVRFEEPVLPEQIKVFETYNPGAIVRIWAYTQAEEWFLLWDLETCNENIPPVERNKARIFCPPLALAPSPTRFIRFEFNHTELEYSTQLDAILMVGQKFIPNVVPPKKQKIPSKITLNHEVILQSYSQDLVGSAPTSRSSTPNAESTPEITLDQMPYDVLFNIMSHLDLRSLYRCGQVCRTFHQIVAVDSLLYAEINLRPYWNCASSELLQSLKKRCAFTKKLNLSWCGLFNKITATEFKEYEKSLK